MYMGSMTGAGMPKVQDHRSLAQRVRRKLGGWITEAQLRCDLRHVQGPRRFDLGHDDVVAIVLIRDFGYYLEPFLRHHRALGIHHFVFVDTGSSDDGVARLVGEPNCAVLRATLPWGRFENDFRRIAAQRYGAGHWCLTIDADEMLDLPDIRPVVARMRAAGHTALVAQMIEMFPDAPLSDVAHLPYDAVLHRFDHCDLSQVTRFAYKDPAIPFAWYLQQNTATHPDTEILFGGVRNRVFGENCCLTKHPLVLLMPGVIHAPHPHCAAKVTCADFSVAIRHYKFANDCLARDRRSVAETAASHGEDRQRLARLGDGTITLMGPAAQRYSGPRMLYEQGVLFGDPP